MKEQQSVTKMKTLLSTAILFCLFSCKSEYVKIEKKLQGSWQLTGFQYLNSSNKLVSDDKSNYIIDFKSDKKGTIAINSKEYNFLYDFGFEQFDSGYANCDIAVENSQLLPIEGIGKVQVYSYKFIDKNTIEFFIDKEFDSNSKQAIKAVTYTFVRK